MYHDKQPQRNMNNSSKASLSNYSEIPIDQMSALLLEKLFRAMQIEFGSRWTSQFTSPQIMADAKREWSDKLSSLTGTEIRAGLDAMDVGPNAWPPGPRAFAKLAKSVSPKDRASYYLPEPEATNTSKEASEEYEKFRAEMRKIFPHNPEEKRREKWRDDIRSGQCRANMTYEKWVELHG